MKTLMRIVFVGLLAISSFAYAGKGKNKTVKAKQVCPTTCNKPECNKKCPSIPTVCAQLHCAHKS